MTIITIKMHGDIPDVSKPLTWGIHKELASYLMEDNKLMLMFTNDDVTENILQICLSERDDYGEVIRPFTASGAIEVTSMIEFLTELHAYFENFFFLNQQRVDKTNKKFQALQDTSQ